MIALVSAKLSSLGLRSMLHDMAIVAVLKTPITRFIRFREGALTQGISYSRKLSFQFDKTFLRSLRQVSQRVLVLYNADTVAEGELFGLTAADATLKG